MQKRLPLLLFPLLLVALAGVIYVQAEVTRTTRAADRALMEGNPAEAAQILAAGARKHPELWERAGNAALQTPDHSTALTYLQNAENAGLLSAAGYLTLGDVYRDENQTDAALAAWQTALAQGAPAPDIYSRLWKVHRAANDFPAALAALRTLTTLTPDDALAQYDLGLLLLLQDPETALTHLTRAAELDPTLTNPVRQLQRSLRPSPDTDDPAYVLVNLGRALASQEEWPLARDAFTQAVTANPEYAEAWAFLGEAKGHLGENGLPELDTALNLSPGSLTANLLYALYQKRQGNYDLALVYLHAADNLEPDNPSVQVEIGSTLNEMGNFNAALGYFQTAVALAPRDATYLHLLAQFCFQNNTQIEEIGIPALREALVLDNQDAAALDLMGFGYYLLNDIPTAQRFLSQALELAPNDPAPWFHLALISLAQGEYPSAQEQLEHAIELAPTSATATQARRVLTQYFP